MALDTTKIRNMSPEDLAKEEDQLREQVWKLRLQMTTGQLQDPSKVRRARKDLARVLTIKREQELSAAEQKSGRRRRK
jgi:large subunit ribosomal protein L29